MWGTWFPHLKEYYDDNHARLHQAINSRFGRDRISKPVFKGLSQASFTCNLGPHSISPMHIDEDGLSFGVTMLSVFGDFDWKNGGEVFLQEPKMIVQMRPGEVLIFPSSSITYGELPLTQAEGQVRYTFTCHSSEALFDWVANNMPPAETSERGSRMPPRIGSRQDWNLYSRPSEVEPPQDPR